MCASFGWWIFGALVGALVCLIVFGFIGSKWEVKFKHLFPFNFTATNKKTGETLVEV